MNRDMLDQSVRAFQRQVPFRPFTVVMTNGNRFEVDFGDAIVCRSGRGVFLSPGGVPILFDHEGVSEIVGDLSNNLSESE